MSKVKNNKRGFTVVETLIVLGIMAIVFSITLIFFNSFKNKESLDKDISLVSEVLREAKHMTINSKYSNQYGVHFDSTGVVLFTGGTYSAIDPTNQIYSFSPSITLYSTNISGGGSDIIFKRITGDTDNNGTVTLRSATASTTKTVTIYKTGLIE